MRHFPLSRLGLVRPVFARLTVCLMVVALIFPAMVSTVSAQNVSADSTALSVGFEASLAKQINDHRIAKGLHPLVSDPRLVAIARARSVEMIKGDWFSHTRPNGTKVFDTLNAKITSRWYLAGENIGWNNYPNDLAAGAVFAAFVGSPGHEANQLGSRWNYFGVGAAVGADGKKMWTVVFLEGADRTAPRATSFHARVSSTHRAVLTWGGSDTFSYGGHAYTLGSHNAGMRCYDVYRRVNGGAWSRVRSCTTTKSYVSGVLTRNARYEWRIRARDRAGNTRYSGVLTTRR